MAIKCCIGCLPPERNGYCHTYCDKYKAAKEKHDQEKHIADQKKDVAAGLAAQAINGINRAYKARLKAKRK